MKIVLAGGGTGGPVVPLMALRKTLLEQHPQTEFLFIGTANGPELQIVKNEHVQFKAIAAGKFHRYFTLKNFVAPFLVITGFFQSLFILKKFKPNIVVSAGGFVAVPVVIAARLLNIQALIHQQDSTPSLTNMILAPFANKITVAFEKSTKDFYSGSGLFGFKKQTKVIWTGNPFHQEFLKTYTESEKQEIRKSLGIPERIPVLLVLGGGTGALGINTLLQSALPELVRTFFVIHAAGKGKAIVYENPNYKAFDFIINVPEIFSISDIIVSRAGLSTITELSVSHKVSIIIPMPNSHQEANAALLQNAEAAMVLNQNETNAEQFVKIIKNLLYDAALQEALAKNISTLLPIDSNRRIATIVVSLCQTHHKKN